MYSSNNEHSSVQDLEDPSLARLDSNHNIVDGYSSDNYVQNLQDEEGSNDDDGDDNNLSNEEERPDDEDDENSFADNSMSTIDSAAEREKAIRGNLIYTIKNSIGWYVKGRLEHILFNLCMKWHTHSYPYPYPYPFYLIFQCIICQDNGSSNDEVGPAN